LDLVLSKKGADRDNAAKKILLAAGNIDFSSAVLQMLYVT
jgi:hypothetical protein